MRASSGDVMGLCVKVILVENALMFRIGIKILLEKGRNLEYIGDVQDGEELLKAIEKKTPDVVIFDGIFTPKKAVPAIKTLVSHHPSIPFLVITELKGFKNLEKYLKLGAKALIFSDATDEELLGAINMAAQGYEYYTVRIVRNISNLLHHYFERRDFEDNFFDGLSKREKEVLELFAQGKSYKEISVLLNISIRTVETHKKNIMSKLKLQSTADIVKYALKYNLLHFQ